jgi:hypothetical protein
MATLTTVFIRHGLSAFCETSSEVRWCNIYANNLCADSVLVTLSYGLIGDVLA